MKFVYASNKLHLVRARARSHLNTYTLILYMHALKYTRARMQTRTSI